MPCAGPRYRSSPYAGRQKRTEKKSQHFWAKDPALSDQSEQGTPLFLAGEEIRYHAGPSPTACAPCMSHTYATDYFYVHPNSHAQVRNVGTFYLQSIEYVQHHAWHASTNNIIDIINTYHRASSIHQVGPI